MGVPWVQAPGEAEAQCVSLEGQGLTGGTVSDDSDVWLFGAERVYRHLFNKTKRVHHYRAADLVDKLGKVYSANSHL